MVNGGVSLMVVISLYEYKFGGGNFALLWQYVFNGKSLALLMKSHMQVVMVLVNGNLTLWKITKGATAA